MQQPSTAEIERIEKAIGRAEARTAGELVVVVASRSDDYIAHRVVFSVGLTIVLASIVAFIWPPSVPGVVVPHALPPWIVPMQVVVATVFWWIASRPGVLRRLVAAEARAEAVDARAKRTFLERGVTETRDRSGVLLFVSRLEHRVEILADKGIHERVGVEGWKKHVDDVVSAIGAGRAVDGLVEAIDAIGDELAEHFPRRTDDVNELEDAVGVVD